MDKLSRSATRQRLLVCHITSKSIFMLQADMAVAAAAPHECELLLTSTPPHSLPNINSNTNTWPHFCLELDTKKRTLPTLIRPH